jgi:hypothetical protein
MILALPLRHLETLPLARLTVSESVSNTVGVTRLARGMEII